MDIKEQKSTLKALLHLSEVYSRFGNIPHFSVVGWLVMGVSSRWWSGFGFHWAVGCSLGC